jgi:alanine-glyoxylate transaminase/serine-glyoxylate transaminase/serine-pyruvate transaminase
MNELLMIPGPVEFAPAVLQAMATKTLSHISPDFIEVFGHSLERLRGVFLTEEGQPFVVAGSGTLAMEMAAANLIEPEDWVLLVDTGYFSHRFASICERYGARVTLVGAKLGDVPSLEEVERSLRGARYKLLLATHVDTSTGVLVDVASLGGLAHRYGALSVVDGVCTVGGQEFRQEEWGIDICLTASQKALGVPPGLAILMVSPLALDLFGKRRTPVANYYADLANWLPVMKAYEARKVGYFGTPPVNLIYALGESLDEILGEGMEARFRRHRLISEAFKAAMTALRLKQVPALEVAAHTMSAIYYPEGVGEELLGEIGGRGVIVAGGLHPQIKERYFRVGHMGGVNGSHILATVGAIEGALQACGYRFELGAGLVSAQKVLRGL